MLIFTLAMESVARAVSMFSLASKLQVSMVFNCLHIHCQKFGMVPTFDLRYSMQTVEQ